MTVLNLPQPTFQVLGLAVLIFFIRFVNISLDTLRVLAIAHGQKFHSWWYGFFQTMLYLSITAWVLNDLYNPYKFIGYCAGFASGNIMGMLIEDRMGFGFMDIQIVCPQRGCQVEELLREAGIAVTKVAGIGKDGTVEMLHCSVRRKSTDQVIQMVASIDSDAFISSQDVRTVSGGFWGKGGK